MTPEHPSADTPPRQWIMPVEGPKEPLSVGLAGLPVLDQALRLQILASGDSQKTVRLQPTVAKFPVLFPARKQITNNLAGRDTGELPIISEKAGTIPSRAVYTEQSI